MAIGAATLDANLGSYNQLRYTTAAAALADNDSFTVGLFGDGGATVAAPANWSGNGTGVAGATGQTEAITDAQRTARTKVTANFSADPSSGAATYIIGPVITKGGAPWRVTVNYQGTAPAAPVTLEFYIEYMWSPTR